MCIEIVSRKAWNSFPTDSELFTKLEFPVDNVFVTFTSTQECDDVRTCCNIVGALQDKALRYKYMEDLYYSFLVGGDGRVYEGRGWFDVPALPYLYGMMRPKSIYIGLIRQLTEAWADMCFEIISREAWNAFPPRQTILLTELEFPVENVFLSYTNTQECNGVRECGSLMRSLQDKAMRYKYMEDIYYSFIIGGDGRVYEGRGWVHSPGLPYKYSHYNKKSIYIALVGQFADKRPPEFMRKARYNLIQHGIATNRIVEQYYKEDIILRQFQRY